MDFFVVPLFLPDFLGERNEPSVCVSQEMKLFRGERKQEREEEQYIQHDASCNYEQDESQYEAAKT